MGGQKVVHCIGPEIIPKNAHLSRFDETQVKGRDFSAIFAIVLKIKKARGRKINPCKDASFVSLAIRFCGRGKDLRVSEWRRVADF